MEYLQELKNIIDPEYLIQVGGITVLALVIFAETGLFFGFFLPGDSLLFTAGLLCGSEYLDIHIAALIGILLVAAIIGDYVGYFFGKKVGAALFQKKDSRIFKQKYMEMTKSFYNKHGAKAVIFGRFFPIIRTFAPILAGTVGISFRTFSMYNIIGALLWIISFTVAGYYLVKLIPNVKDYLHFIIIGIIVASVIPVVLTFLKERKNSQANH